jgi:hypothetical protein
MFVQTGTGLILQSEVFWDNIVVGCIIAAAAALFSFQTAGNNFPGGPTALVMITRKLGIFQHAGSSVGIEVFEKCVSRFSVLSGPCYVLASPVSLPDDRRYQYLASPTAVIGAAVLTRRKRLWNMCLSGLGSFWLPAMSLPRQLTRRPEILVPCISHRSSGGISAYLKEESCLWA